MQSYTLTNLLVTLEHGPEECRIRLNIDSKQIFNDLCGIYGPQTISMRTFLGVWVGGGGGGGGG